MIADYLKSAVGPAPWYWKRFPKMQGAKGTYHWQDDGDIYLVTDSEPLETKFAVRIYTRVFPITSKLFGIWYQEKGQVVISAYDPDTLEYVISENQGVSDRKINACYGQSFASISLSCNLNEGIHPIVIPDAFPDLPEIFLIVNKDQADNYFYSIYVLNIRERVVNVYPQKWLTAQDYDLGYQWITAVTRNPENGRLIGEGFRMDPFMLTQDGCYIDQWFGTEWEIARPHLCSNNKSSK